ncbi:hypothetical protein ADUPG1_009664, partial [Aduncisulcus paluster]
STCSDEGCGLLSSGETACYDHGTCVQDDSGSSYCYCSPGWDVATACNTVNGDCGDSADSFCSGNSGECVSIDYLTGESMCECKEGWDGDLCTDDICVCDPDHGLACNTNSTTGERVCLCLEGWSGPSCSVPSCSCGDTGSCVLQSSGALVCECILGWGGSECSVDTCGSQCITLGDGKRVNISMQNQQMSFHNSSSSSGSLFPLINHAKSNGIVSSSHLLKGSLILIPNSTDKLASSEDMTLCDGFHTFSREILEDDIEHYLVICIDSECHEVQTETFTGEVTEYISSSQNAYEDIVPVPVLTSVFSTNTSYITHSVSASSSSSSSSSSASPFSSFSLISNSLYDEIVSSSLCFDSLDSLPFRCTSEVNGSLLMLDGAVYACIGILWRPIQGSSNGVDGTLTDIGDDASYDRLYQVFSSDLFDEAVIKGRGMDGFGFTSEISENDVHSKYYESVHSSTIILPLLKANSRSFSGCSIFFDTISDDIIVCCDEECSKIVFS